MRKHGKSFRDEGGVSDAMGRAWIPGGAVKFLGIIGVLLKVLSTP